MVVGVRREAVAAGGGDRRQRTVGVQATIGAGGVMLQPIDEPPQRLSRAEYRAWADAQPRGRFERHSGVVVAMAPERAIHALLKVAAWLLLRQSIQVQPAAMRGVSRWHDRGDRW